MSKIDQMPNLLDDNYQCIMGIYNLFQIVVFLRSDSNLGNKRVAEKVKSANV